MGSNLVTLCAINAYKLCEHQVIQHHWVSYSFSHDNKAIKWIFLLSTNSDVYMHTNQQQVALLSEIQNHLKSQSTITKSSKRSNLNILENLALYYYNLHAMSYAMPYVYCYLWLFIAHALTQCTHTQFAQKLLVHAEQYLYVT